MVVFQENGCINVRTGMRTRQFWLMIGVGLCVLWGCWSKVRWTWQGSVLAVSLHPLVQILCVFPPVRRRFDHQDAEALGGPGGEVRERGAARRPELQAQRAQEDEAIRGPDDAREGARCP